MSAWTGAAAETDREVAVGAVVENAGVLTMSYADYWTMLGKETPRRCTLQIGGRAPRTLLQRRRPNLSA